MSSHDTAKKQSSRDWHKADIKAALEKAGWSLSRLSIYHGYNRSVLKSALIKPYPKAERRIAEAIGVSPEIIWPSRYDMHGIPNRHRGRKSTNKCTSKSGLAA